MGKAQSKFRYSVPINEFDENKGETSIMRHPDFVDELVCTIKRWPGVKTLQDLYVRSFKEYSNNNCLGTRMVNPDGTKGAYRFKAYFEIKAIADRIGSAIMNLDLAPFIKDETTGEDYRFIGIYAKNREEWISCDIASILYGITTLPFYDTLGLDALKFVFQQTSVQTVFTSSDHILQLVKHQKSGDFASLKAIVSFDPLMKEHEDAVAGTEIKLYDWNSFISNGAKFVEYAKVKPDSVFTFCYTSGTTALPKAAMLTHKNSMAMIAAIEECDFLAIDKVNASDSYLSYLPLAHVYERNMIPTFFSRGASIGLFSGDVMKLKDDLQALRPTIFVSVPRLFGKFHDVIKDQLDKLEGFKKNLAVKAVASKLDNLKTKNEYKHLIYDPLIFKKMREALGGRVKIAISGSAPISPDVADFLKICFSCPVLEGYGSTETCSGVFCQHPSDGSAGHVGGPIGSCEYKLVDIPDMNYTSRDKNDKGERTPRGEICLRGPFVFKGYYKDVEKTNESIDKDGWLHTGDVGLILPNGALKIIDRKKNLFKLAQGEYLAPEKIENIYLTSKYVGEVFVHGDSFQTFCIAIVVPDKKKILELSEQLGIKGEYEGLCKEQKIIDKVHEDMNKIGKASGLHGFELAKKIYLEPTSFVLLDLATPTLKLKRPPARKHFEEIINKLYAAANEKPSGAEKAAS